MSRRGQIGLIPARHPSHQPYSPPSKSKRSRDKAATYCLNEQAASSIFDKFVRSGGQRTDSIVKIQSGQYSFRRVEPLSDKIVYTSDSGFEADVLQSDKAVLVDFWAEWCGPCKMIAPILNEAADEYEDRMAVAKLNIDENPSTPNKYGIRSIPTLMLFKDGAVQAQKVGAMSKSQLTEFLETNL